MGALLIFDRLQLVCVYLDGGATEIADFTANEGFFALNALHVGHDAGKVAVDDTHFVALLEGVTLYLGLPCRHDSSEILKRVIRNGIGDTFSRFGEDFVDIGAEADLIEIFVLPPRLFVLVRFSKGSQVSKARFLSWKYFSMSILNFFS